MSRRGLTALLILAMGNARAWLRDKQEVETPTSFHIYMSNGKCFWGVGIFLLRWLLSMGNAYCKIKWF